MTPPRKDGGGADHGDSSQTEIWSAAHRNPHN